MFHNGDLQSGIALAIAEQKSVACFVHDHSSESETWEKEWLRTSQLSSVLPQTTVLLRLEAGSAEAGFLGSFCPISQTPTLVVIHNGQVKEQLTPGVTRQDFISRLVNAVTGELTDSTARSTVQSPTSAPPALSEKAKGKQKATNVESKPLSSTQKESQTAREALRKKRQEENEELKRIQARIEADKAERKAQAEARKAERKLQEQQATQIHQQLFPRTDSKARSQAREVHLNVRLFDGHTVRATFPRTATLQDDVRPWIDQEFAVNAETPSARHPPYIFKQILAPLPSKELTMSEEDKALGDIDFAPSATLVLIPVQGYVDAYNGSGGGVVGSAVNGVTGVVSGAFGLVSSVVGYVGSSLGSVIGYGAAPHNQEQASGSNEGSTASQPAQDSRGTAGIRVRTLADQRAREPNNQQFYNGNQLDFEPNHDDGNQDRR